MIFYQEDYQLTRLINCEKGGCQTLNNLPSSEKKAMIATEVAYGFGCEDEDIIYINGLNAKEIEKGILLIRN